MREVRSGAELRSYARNRLIESRLTPNAISMTGLVLNVAAAVLILERHFVLGALAFIIGSIMDTSAEAFDHTMAILSRAVFLGIKHAARAMRDQGSGSIVSLSSTAGVMGGLGPHVYTMAKHGVVGITRSAAAELAALGIRVNAVAPGGTVTPMTSALGDGDFEETARFIAEGSPLGQPCMPEDIANGILFLLSGA